MIKLLDYRIDTQGILSPLDVLYHMDLITTDMTICRINEEVRFDSLDGERRFYKVKEPFSKFIKTNIGRIEAQDLYVATRASRVLYR